jgi:ribosomal protein S27AE
MNPCTKCGGQMMPDRMDPPDAACIQCGHREYAKAVAVIRADPWHKKHRQYGNGVIVAHHFKDPSPETIQALIDIGDAVARLRAKP